MPTIYTGASIEPAEMQILDLKEAQDLLMKEMKKRCWKYIREIGYNPYIETDLAVRIETKGERILVVIDCAFEERHEKLGLHFDVPLKHFESLVPPKPTTNALRPAAQAAASG